MSKKRNLITGIAAFAALSLAAGPAAGAPGGEHGKPADKPGKKPKGVSYVFKGTYGGDSTVTVDKCNKHGKNGVPECAADAADKSVAFNFEDAKIKANDAAGARTSNLDDVLAGERVLVKAKLPRQDPGPQPFDARQLVEQSGGYEAETG